MNPATVISNVQTILTQLLTWMTTIGNFMVNNLLFSLTFAFVIIRLLFGFFKKLRNIF